MQLGIPPTASYREKHRAERACKKSKTVIHPEPSHYRKYRARLFLENVRLKTSPRLFIHGRCLCSAPSPSPPRSPSPTPFFLSFFYHAVKLRFRVAGIGKTRVRYYLVFIVLVKSICARRCSSAHPPSAYVPTGNPEYIEPRLDEAGA